MKNPRLGRFALTAIAGAMLLTNSYAVSQNVQTPGPAKADAAEVLLPNGWRLTPAGSLRRLSDLPLNLALTPDGQYLAMVYSGYGENAVAIREVKTDKLLSRVTLDAAWFGLEFAPDGKTLYASGADSNSIYVFDFSKGYLTNPRQIALGGPKAEIYPAGLAASRDGSWLYSANNLGHSLSVIDAKRAAVVRTIPIGPETYPYTCVPDADGKTVYVSLWGSSAVAVVDTTSGKVLARIATDDHPNAMLISPDGKTLFVANANSDTVSVIDLKTRKRLETISTALYPKSPEGSTPNALAMSKDGKTLLIANADNNDVAVVDYSPGKSSVSGFIPTGWYPTAVQFSPDQKKIYVLDGKGNMSVANPQGQYVAQIQPGMLSIINTPDAKTLAKYTQQVYANSPYMKDSVVTARSDGPNPVPARVGDSSPIRYVVYIIKENRTYDQVMGDIKEGNGEKSLCLFCERVTPNHHALARDFVLLDNFYANADVSASGHNWSMGAYATDYVEKLWPQSYSRERAYDFEGADVAAPSIGYIWDQAQRAGITYRSYGEFVENGKTAAEPAHATRKSLEGHFDPGYRGWDLEYKDVDRAKRFLSEVHGFESNGEMPRLSIVRLGNDHTAGTKPGSHTPDAMVADNDLALGTMIEGLSRSKFWNQMAIFVVEDDAQSGSDHVDAHRTVAFAVSPYVRRKAVDSTMYSTVSMLRTMELILGIPPMSQFDAGAHPMYNAFTMTPDFSPYVLHPATLDIESKNTPAAFGAQRSQQFNLAKEDKIPEREFNEILWKAAYGSDSEMPAPVRAGFIRPLPTGDGDD